MVASLASGPRPDIPHPHRFDPAARPGGAALTIRERHPDVGVVVLFRLSDPSYVLALRNASRQPLERALRAMALGESSIDPGIIAVLVQSHSKRPSGIDRLAAREGEGQ